MGVTFVWPAKEVATVDQRSQQDLHLLSVESDDSSGCIIIPVVVETCTSESVWPAKEVATADQ